VFVVLAAAAAVAAILLPSSCGIQGAYFDRSTDAPRAIGNVAISSSGVCWAPDFLLGIAAGLTLAAAAIALIGWRVSWRAAS
jgi:hypothetical protein